MPHVQLTSPRAVLPAAAAAPALHKLAALSGMKSHRQPANVHATRRTLRDLLCCQASKGWQRPAAAQEHQSCQPRVLQGRLASIYERFQQHSQVRSLTTLLPAACGRSLSQQALTVGLSILMTLSPALCSFSPAAAQQISLTQSSALLSRQ